MNNNPNPKTQILKPTKILVTGAKGQLGKKIIELMKADFELVLTDSDNMDITDGSKVREFIKSERPDFIIHGAAYTAVDKAEDNVDLCRKINADGTKNIAVAAKEFDSTLFYISTDYVFDGKKKTPYTETDATNPLSIYGQTKLEGEKFIQQICDKYYIIRSAWIFGELPENHPGTNFVETMLKLAKERDSLKIVSDQIGSPTYTGDLVEIIRRIIGAWGLGFRSSDISQNLKPKSQVPFGLYHFSGDGKCSWFDFAEEIFRQNNIKIKLDPITSDQYPQKAKRPTYSYLDKTKIENALDIKVRPWQEMLAEYLKRRIL